MDKRIVNNAISAYLGMGLLLLVPTKNEYIKNDFVKSHAKTASIIHILFIVNYFIFITLGLFGKIIVPFIHYNLNNLISCIIFIILFLVLLFGIYKVTKEEYFGISDINKATKTEKLVEMKKSNLNEQGILTIILSYIPFIGYYIYAKFYNYKSPVIVNNVKLNFLITAFLIFIFLLGYGNIVSLLALCYIVFIIFLSILIISNENLLNFNLSKVPTFEELRIYLISVFIYLKKYFSGEKFENLNEIIMNIEESKRKKDLEEKEELNARKEMKLPKYLIYIPYINLITLLEIKSKYKNHIINGFLITLLSILFIFLGNNYQILLLIPIFSGIGFIKKIEYKIPFIFDIYEIFFKFKNLIFRGGRKIKEQRNKVEEITIKL